MSDWPSLENPTTATGVLSRDDVHPLNRIHHKEPEEQPAAPVPVPVPASSSAPEPWDRIAAAVEQAAKRAVTQQFQLTAAQQKALSSAKEAEEEFKKDQRSKRIKWVAGVLGVLIGGGSGGGVWMSQKDKDEDAPVETTEALRRQDVEVRLSDTESDVGVLQTTTKEIEESLEEHIDEQREVNTAQKLSGARQEMMLEQLLRSQGRRPPARVEDPDAVLPAPNQ